MQVLLADDHDLVRDGLKPYIEKLDEAVNIREAGTFEEVVTKSDEEADPDIILLDLHMPGMQGLNSIPKVKDTYPTSPIVVISGHFDSDVISGSLEKGASGFIPKTTRGQSLLSALRLVLEGETYIPPALVSGETGGGAGERLPGRPAAFGQDNVLSKLSARETSILKLLIDGLTNKKIARELDLQEITIKVHLRNAYRKIGATNRADAVRIAFQHGWQ